MNTTPNRHRGAWDFGRAKVERISALRDEYAATYRARHLAPADRELAWLELAWLTESQERLVPLLSGRGLLRTQGTLRVPYARDFRALAERKAEIWRALNVIESTGKAGRPAKATPFEKLQAVSAAIERAKAEVSTNDAQ